MVGQAPVPGSGDTTHVWIELPKLGYGIETNPSQLRHLPLVVQLLPLADFAAFVPWGTWPKDRDQLSAYNPTIARLTLTSAGRRFYDKLADEVVGCVSRA